MISSRALALLDVLEYGRLTHLLSVVIRCTKSSEGVEGACSPPTLTMLEKVVYSKNPGHYFHHSDIEGLL
jgi:hypothetical protein